MDAFASPPRTCCVCFLWGCTLSVWVLLMLGLLSAPALLDALKQQHQADSEARILEQS